VKREARLLLGKASDSLVLCVELFNRPYDRGRTTTCLILAGHAFEMLLKAVIIKKNGRIREEDETDTIGFDKCVAKCWSDGQIRFLTEEQTLTLRSIGAMRDAAQHYMNDVTEELLYMWVQASVTLFDDILESVFQLHLRDLIPLRVLPVSTTPPVSIDMLFDKEVAAVSILLAAGRRRGLEAQMKLRPLVTLNKALQGESSYQPTDIELRGTIESIRKGIAWQELFPGVASLSMSPTGSGLSLAIRLTKKDGPPVTVVPLGTPGAVAVVEKRVNELGYYSLTRSNLAAKVGLTGSQTDAVIWHFGFKSDPDLSKIFEMGVAKFWRYSPKAIDRIRDILSATSLDPILHAYYRRNADGLSGTSHAGLPPV